MRLQFARRALIYSRSAVAYPHSSFSTHRSFIPPMPSSIIPCLRYRDASAAIDWLCRVIGFEKKMVVPGEAGAIMHAELKLGDGMIMLGSGAKPETEYSKVMPPPAEIGGKQTQPIYVVVADA